MRRWKILAAVGAILFSAIVPGQAQAPSPADSSGRPDVLILVLQQPGQADTVDITYARTVPHSQAQRDLNALAQTTGWAMGQSRISEGSSPAQPRMKMTSSVFTAPGILRNGADKFPLEDFVTAFRSYKHLTLIFSVSPGYQFQGPSDYLDNDIQVALQQRGTIYTYRVQILNTQFSHLNLTVPASVANRVPHRASPWLLLLAILAAATAAGGLVYALMARKTGASLPPSNTDDKTDAPAEEQVKTEERMKIGTKG